MAMRGPYAAAAAAAAPRRAPQPRPAAKAAPPRRAHFRSRLARLASAQDGGGARATTDATPDEVTWRPSSPSWTEPTTSPKARLALLLGVPENSQQTSGVEKPLRVNQDLALYRARCTRSRWFKTRNKTSARAIKVFDTCMRQYQAALAIDPSDMRAYVGLGRLLVVAGRYDDARLVYEEGNIACGGENAFLWQALAVLEEKCGRYREARECFDAATAADEQHVAAWHGWGMLEKRQGNLKRARDLFIKGVRIVERDAAKAKAEKLGDSAGDNPAVPREGEPDDSESLGRHVDYIYQSLAVMAIHAKRYDEAREWFRRGTNGEYSPTGPKNAALWEGWARMERDIGDFSRARELYREGLRNSPRSRYLWLGWALLERKVKNFERSRQLFARGSATSGDAVMLQAWACLEAEDLRNIPRARQLFKKAIEANPKHLPSYQAYGRMEWRNGDVEGARDLFQRGIWADPNAKGSCHIFQAWGLLERYEGNVGMARELFKCAIKVDPRSEHTWDAWFKLEEAEGNFMRAQELRSLRNQTNVEEDLSALDFSPSVLVDDMASDSGIGEFIKGWMQRVSG